MHPTKIRLFFTTAFFSFLLLTLVQADSFFVTNLGTNTVTRYDERGNGSPFTNSFINGPTGIALDASGNVYVATHDNTVEKFTADGTALGIFARAGLNNPMGLAFNPAGHLFPERSKCMAPGTSTGRC